MLFFFYFLTPNYTDLRVDAFLLLFTPDWKSRLYYCQQFEQKGSDTCVDFIFLCSLITNGVFLHVIFITSLLICSLNVLLVSSAIYLLKIIVNKLTIIAFSTLRYAHDNNLLKTRCHYNVVQYMIAYIELLKWDEIV